jgi:hypothetical protein
MFPEALAARYRCLGLLGEGASAAVFLAEDRELAREVAVKLMTQAQTPTNHTRFQREARLLAEIRHPNLVELYEAGVVEDRNYLVMERLEGDSLDRAPPPHQLEEIALAVGAGLEAIHGTGAVHRDVKPANIFRTRDGRVVLMDLGMAFHPDRTRVTGRDCLVGSLAFLAPEALRQRDPDPAGDWWALGVTLFFLAEGRIPHEVDDLLGCMKGRDLSAPEYRALEPGTPMRRLVEGLLTLAPGDRLSGVAAMRALLEPRRVRRRARPRRRGWWRRIAAGLVVSAGLVVAHRYLAASRAPSPPVAGVASSEGLGDRVRQQYFALEGHASPHSPAGGPASPLLEPDPANWSLVLDRCLALGEALDRVAEGGQSGHLSEELTQDLEDLDDFFEGQGFDPPFLAVRTTRPVAAPVAAPAFPSRILLRPGTDASASGWLGRAFQAANDLRAAEARRRAEFAAPRAEAPAVPEVLRGPAARVMDLERALGHCRLLPGTRRAVHAWLRPEVDEYRRLLVALTRAVDLEEPDALAFAFALVGEADWVLPMTLAGATSRWVLGAPPDNPARRLLAAMVQRRLLHVSRDVGGRSPEEEGAILLRELEEVRRHAATRATPDPVISIAWMEAIEVHRKLEEHDQALEVFRSIDPPPWTWSDLGVAMGLLRMAGQLFKDRQGALRPREVTRAGVRDFAARWKAAGHPGTKALLRDFGLDVEGR